MHGRLPVAPRPSNGWRRRREEAFVPDSSLARRQGGGAGNVGEDERDLHELLVLVLLVVDEDVQLGRAEHLLSFGAGFRVRV